MKKSLLTYFIATSFIIMGGPVNAQFINDDYKVEFIYGVSKGTNGGLLSGFYARRGVVFKKNIFRHYILEFANIKHPKETRVTSASGNSYILGKSNYLYVIRGGYGMEHIIFKKAAQHGVQVSFLYSGGLSMGVVSNYYVKLFERERIGNLLINKTREEPYTYEMVENGKVNRITGNGNSFAGLGHAIWKPGLFLKTSMGFEFGTINKQVSGFEIGVLIDAYSSKIELMPNVENNSVYTQVFFSLYYGFRK